jgi:nucleoside-diphosphate-sugar epimerase
MIRESFEDRKVRIEHVDQRAGEIIKNFSSIWKAQKYLGWSPEVELPEGLQATLDQLPRRIGTSQ